VQDSDTIRIISIDSFAVIRNDTIRFEKIITTKEFGPIDQHIASTMILLLPSLAIQSYTYLNYEP
jgi:hypothetical protein